MRDLYRHIAMKFGLILVALASCVAGVPRADAISISPRRIAAVRGTPDEARLQEGFAAFLGSWRARVGDSFNRFALTPAKFSRDGFAHRNVLVILADFPRDDYGAELTHASPSTGAYYHRLFFSDDETDGVTSMREYYRDNSRGRLIVSGSVVPGWLTMPHSAAYYIAGGGGTEGAYPRNAQRLAEDAIGAAYSELGDLSFYDNDGPDGIPASGDDDGYIDAVCVIHPGTGGEQECDYPAACTFLWSHQFGLAAYSDCPPGPSSPGCLPGLPYGGVRGYLFLVVPEYTEFPGDLSCGTYFHEFGHTLGLPDLYDTNSRAGIGFYSLMGVGNYLPYDPTCSPRSDPNCPVLASRPGNLDAWCRQFLGFETPETPGVPGSFSLPPVTRGGTSVKLWRNGQAGTEYFLVENRLREGSDAGLPGDGLLVYHVDDVKIDNITGPSTYRVRVVAADNRDDLESPTGNYGDAGDLFPGTFGVTGLTQSTTPNSRDYAGQDTGVRLTNIAVTTGGASPAATFDLALSIAPDLRVMGWTAADAGGDGDGYPDNGETITLSVTVRNVGSPSGATAYTLTTSDPGITITQDAAVSGAIPTAGTEPLLGAFTFIVGAFAPLPHDIPFTLSWTDGSAAGAMAFTVAVGMGAGLSADFEGGGLGSWSGLAVAPSPVNQWHASPTRARGGAQSAKCGSTLPFGGGSNEAQTYGTYLDAALTSPLFDLPPGSQLAFWSFMDAETNGGTSAWDGGRVEIAGADGAWRPVNVDGGYPYLIENDVSNALRGSSAFSGSPNAWRRVVADLSGYSGPSRLRFRFASDDENWPVDRFGAQVRYYEGWYVDDVSVEARVAPGPTPRSVTLRAGPSPYQLGAPSAGVIHIRFSARDGLPHSGAVGRVRVFNLNGRLIRTLIAAPTGIEPSQFETAWNARAEDGTRVAAGIYFLQSEVLGHIETSRLVVLK
jgi:M6 family metalloprotease-like protein